MANPTGKDVTFQIDDATSTGVITDISSHVNSASIQAAMTMIEDSALGDADRTYLAGLHGKTIPVNGFWNTTTEAIYGPLLDARTTRTKTAEYGDGNQFYQGEVLVDNVQVTGAPDTAEVFSAGHTFTGAITRTSVGL